MEIILSHMTHLLSFLLFIHFFHIEYPLLIETSLLRSYVLFFFLFIIIINFYLRGFTVFVNGLSVSSSLFAQKMSASAVELGFLDEFCVRGS
jgi:hypothetical protein